MSIPRGDLPMRERRVLTGRAFRNLHHAGVVYSVRGSEGRTILHSENILIADALFVIQKGTQAAVRKKGKKQVHAFVQGRLIIDPMEAEKIMPLVRKSKETAYYNPFKTDGFVDRAGKPLKGAGFVYLTNDGKGKSRLLLIDKQSA